MTPRSASIRSRRTLIIFAVLPIAICALVAFAIYKSHEQQAPPDFLDRSKIAAYTNLIAFVTEVIRHADTTNISALSLNKSDVAALQRALKDPIEAPDAAYDAATMLADHRFVKPFGQSLISNAQTAEANRRHKEAADLYAAAFRLSVRYEHGPLIYFLVGSSGERAALRSVKTLIPKLSINELSAFAKELQTINQERIPFSEVIRRERYFISRNSKNIIELARTQFSLKLKNHKAQDIHLEIETTIEGICTAAAILAYRRENQPPLTSLQLLIPKYLKSIPIDPHTGAPLLLLSTTTGPVVYSVGPNQRDESARGDDVPFYFDK